MVDRDLVAQVINDCSVFRYAFYLRFLVHHHGFPLIPFAQTLLKKSDEFEHLSKSDGVDVPMATHRDQSDEFHDRGRLKTRYVYRSRRFHPYRDIRRWVRRIKLLLELQMGDHSGNWEVVSLPYLNM